jgi:hypothetical protein
LKEGLALGIVFVKIGQLADQFAEFGAWTVEERKE